MYPPLSDYALIGDCHTAALVSRSGSIDWCCLPRFDSESCFGRLLDWQRGGYFAITPRGRYSVRREYLGESLILATTFECAEGSARLIECVSMRRGGRTRPRRELIRMVEGLRGRVDFDVDFVPRFDFGEVKPWIQPIDGEGHFAVGGSTAPLIFGNVPLQADDAHALRAELTIAAGERRHIALQTILPEELITKPPERGQCAKVLEEHFEETVQWWRDWVSKISIQGDERARIVRSAMVLKALSYAPTGAIIAAPTTSLPEDKVEAIRADLEHEGLVERYRTEDGMRGDEGVFLPCSFWLAECLAKQGRREEAEAVFARACGCANDLGLFSEEYAVGNGAGGMMRGNFPQGLSHLAHISAAMALANVEGVAPPRAAGRPQGPRPNHARR